MTNTDTKKHKVNKVRKNTDKISIWKFIDKPTDKFNTLAYHRKMGTIPNFTGIYFRSKKEALEWKEKFIKERKMWECSLFKIDMYFKESKQPRNF